MVIIKHGAVPDSLLLYLNHLNKI